jgi:hypothetical protein
MPYENTDSGYPSKQLHEVTITILCIHTNKASILDLIHYKNILVKTAVT